MTATGLTAPVPSGAGRTGPVAGGGMALATAAVLAHAGPALTAIAPLRRRLLPELSGIGRPGGIALTFDDGPDPLGTPAVLDALAGLGWTATFFMLGRQVRAHPDIARRVVSAGHEIAVHGDRHRNHLTRTPGALLQDVRCATEVISRVTGVLPRWYRPPYGVLSGGTLRAARAAGLQPVLWTAWGKDWTCTSPELITRTVLRDLRERGTVLLHDSDCTSTAGSWRSTADSLPLLATRLHSRGWSVRTLSQHMSPHLPERLALRQCSDASGRPC
ncbi:MAG: polysaccharide deacetylase family protein [Mycobacteriales bacterium]